MWLYKIPPGWTYENGVQRSEVSYSGFGQSKNDPTKCAVPFEGPIPPGKYRVGPAYDDPGGLGLLVMRLDPLPGTNTYGRSDFRWHGDSSAHPGQASHGCICSPHSLRLAVDASQDRVLEVTA